MRDFINKKVRNLAPSGIRRFFDLASTRKDVISLGVGEPDFITPWSIREAGIATLKKGYTQYTSNKGLSELRNEISYYLRKRFNVNFDHDNIIITLGASEGIDLAIRTVVDEGDEILIPDPSYVSYSPCVELAGGKAIRIKTDIFSGFRITPENLEAVITDKTKAVIFPYPNNPTGAIMEKEYVEKLIPVIKKYDLLIIADEIYAELTYGEKHTSIASFPELSDRIIYISGFSKSFAMTGWRIGYIASQKELSKAMLKIHQYTAICAPIFSQYAALSGLIFGKQNDYSFIQDMLDEYDKRRKYLIHALQKLNLTCFEPKGGFYIFPNVEKTGFDGDEFATRLLEDAGVAVVPGSAFGEFGKNYVRISYAYSMDQLIKAVDRIGGFINKLY